MDPKSIITAILWLAALGLVVIVGTRVVGKVGTRAASAI